MECQFVWVLLKGLGRYSQQVAQRLDGIVEAAEANGIAIQLVLQHHGQFSTTTNPQWDQNPYNVNRGGMLETAETFFTDPEARRLTRNKYRYIVARWGYSPAILAWELFNEVQFTDGWRNRPETVVAWHREMADYLYEIDPHQHLVTTSSDTGDAFAAIWNINSIDLVQHHQYGSPTIESYRDMLMSLQEKIRQTRDHGGVWWLDRARLKGIPTRSTGAPNKRQLLEGASDAAGGPGPRPWSRAVDISGGGINYIEPYDLYEVFKPLQLFLQDELLAGLETAPRVVAGAQSQTARPLLDEFLGCLDPNGILVQWG